MERRQFSLPEPRKHGRKATELRTGRSDRRVRIVHMRSANMRIIYIIEKASRIGHYLSETL